MTFESCLCFYYVMKSASGFMQVVEDPVRIRDGRLCRILYGLYGSVETKGFSISLTVSYLMFPRKSV